MVPEIFLSGFSDLDWQREGKALPKATLPFNRAMPGMTHMALVELEKAGILKFVISQVCLPFGTFNLDVYLAVFLELKDAHGPYLLEHSYGAPFYDVVLSYWHVSHQFTYSLNEAEAWSTRLLPHEALVTSVYFV